MTDPKQPQKVQAPIKINLPPEIARGHIINASTVQHSPVDFVMDFIQIIPGVETAEDRARIIMSPQHAKAFLGALTENVKKHEERFGQIEIIENPIPVDIDPSEKN